MKKTIRATGFATLLLASPALGFIQGCTELSETPLSAITPENYYKNEEEVIGGLSSVYAEMRGTLWGYYNMSTITTDELIVPTRGSDWYDNGRWLEIHRQTYTPTSPSGLDDLNGVWVNCFTGISRANVVLGALQNTTIPNQAVVEAELKTLRAFYYYMLMDMFGGVPIVETSEIKPRERASRKEVFEWIEKELTAARASLPDVWPAAGQGRMTKGAADAILANMYLNAEVFTGTVTAAGLQKGTAMWQKAIDAADRIISSPNYALATDWKANFRHDNFNSKENILVVKHLPQDGLGFEMIYRGLHYTQTSPSPWNGFATLAEVYSAFDADDQRRGIFLEGPQFSIDNPTVPVNDRENKRLVFTPEIKDANAASEGEGVRIYKWPLDPNHAGSHHGNDFAYFRLAEMYLIKAEALNELNNQAGALTLINTLRARVFEPDEPLPSMSQAALRDAILRERLFELTAEAKRRQDLIRHGKFTARADVGIANGKVAREPYRILMPIPQTQVDANPLLQQNPGY